VKQTPHFRPLPTISGDNTASYQLRSWDPLSGVKVQEREADTSLLSYRPALGFLFGILGGGVQLGPLGTAATNRPIVPAPGDYYDREIGGIIGRGSRSTRRKLTLGLLCPPQTPHAARTRTRAAAVGSQRLTAELRHGQLCCILFLKLQPIFKNIYNFSA
jgi:hypothetical protein